MGWRAPERVRPGSPHPGHTARRGVILSEANDLRLVHFAPLTRRTFLMHAGTAGAGLLLTRQAWSQASGPVVRTRDGGLRGEALQDCSVFRGVPFAAPPRRFLAPEPPAPWAGVRDATRFAPAAMQDKLASDAESEDCLYLNVWSPTAPGPHPVLVWIHGGGFVGGRSSDPLENGAVFARQGIVAVTITYRLGVWGFLDVSSLLGGEYRGSADNALRDTMQALAWVQESIADFGGDPTRVTVAGQSAGAKLIGALMGVPSAQRLFQQAISESGGAERVNRTARAEEVGPGVAQSWARPPASGLTAAPAVLLAAQDSFDDSWPQHFPLRPSLDPSLLPALPVDSVRAGLSKNKRLLIGTNRDESAFFLGPRPATVTARELGNVPLASFNAVAQKYEQAYPHTDPSRLRIREVTAEEYWVPSMRLLDAHASAGGAAYAYRFDWTHSTGELAGFAYHSIELPLVWAPDPQPGLAREVQAAWVNFIRTGTPAAEGLPEWPQYTATQRSAMILNTGSRVEPAFGEEELGLWQGVL